MTLFQHHYANCARNDAGLLAFQSPRHSDLSTQLPPWLRPLLSTVGPPGSDTTLMIFDSSMVSPRLQRHLLVDPFSSASRRDGGFATPYLSYPSNHPKISTARDHTSTRVPSPGGTSRFLVCSGHEITLIMLVSNC